MRLQNVKERVCVNCERELSSGPLTPSAGSNASTSSDTSDTYKGRSCMLEVRFRYRFDIRSGPTPPQDETYELGDERSTAPPAPYGVLALGLDFDSFWFD